MLQVANLADTKKNWKMIGTLAHGYTSETSPREPSYKYQHDS